MSNSRKDEKLEKAAKQLAEKLEKIVEATSELNRMVKELDEAAAEALKAYMERVGPLSDEDVARLARAAASGNMSEFLDAEVKVREWTVRLADNIGYTGVIRVAAKEMEVVRRAKSIFFSLSSVKDDVLKNGDRVFRRAAEILRERRGQTGS